MITNAFLDVMQKGGYPFMIPLLCLSVVSLAVIIERSFALWRRTLISADDYRKARELAGVKDNDGLHALFNMQKSITALLITDAVAILMMSKGTMTFEKALEHSADKNIDLLNQRFWMLQGISHVAPIIGLLGTVVGLAISFNNIGKVGLTQQSVASGIAMALITTIAGLSIALPTILAEYCLKSWSESQFRKIRALLHELAIWYGQEQ